MPRVVTPDNINNINDMFEILPEDAPNGNAIFKLVNSKFAGIQYTYNTINMFEDPELPEYLTLKYEYDIIHLPNKDMLQDDETKKELENLLGDIVVYMISEGRLNDNPD
jgi:hypothetical protein